MQSHPFRTQAREFLLIALPIVVLTALALWATYQFVAPPPPSKIVISSGSETGAYHKFAKAYAKRLAKSGIEVEVLTSKGSIENYARLTGEDSSPQRADIALVQGGTANEKNKKGILSLGRVFTEPLWVFYRSKDTLDRLAQLKGQRLAIGAKGSGTRILADALLAKNSINPSNTQLLPLGSREGAKALLDGKADAVFLVMAPNAELVHTLLKTPDVRLMNFKRSEAYTRLFPYLTSVTLPAGVIDLVKNTPDQDIKLVAPEAALVAREAVHPAIIGLIVQAATEIHGEGGMFHRIGQYPKPHDPDFKMSPDAKRMYKSGAPFFRRYLPFWLATFIERMLVMIVPIATIMIPLVKILPMAYEWRIKSRINYWYAHLKQIEKGLKEDTQHARTDFFKDEISEIEEAVSDVKVPLNYSDRFYELRAAVDLVRQRINARANSSKKIAQTG